jgi:hypothetical protein
MKHLFVLILFIAGFTGTSFAQLGKMQFQDAEQAFSESKFEEAIQFLNEAEKSNGKTNPLIMHLRILSRAEVIKKDPEKDFDIIDKLRKEVNLFLKQYEADARLEDKYRDVYQVSKHLKNLPLTRQQFEDEIRSTKEAAALKQEQEKKEKLQRFLTYRHVEGEGFQKGIPLETFLKQNKLKKGHVKIGDDGYQRIDRETYQLIFYNGGLAGYEFQKSIEDNSTHEQGKNTLAEYKVYFTDLFGFEPEETEKQYPTGHTGTWCTWQSGNKTFRFELYWGYKDAQGKYFSTFGIYDIDKS